MRLASEGVSQLLHQISRGKGRGIWHICKMSEGVFSEVLYPKGSSNLNMGVGCGYKMEWPMKMTVIAQIRVVRPIKLCFSFVFTQRAEQVTLFCRQQVEYSDDDEPKPSVHLSQAQKLRKVIVELVDTERSYVKVNTNHIFQFLIHQLSFRLNVSVELIFSLDEGENVSPCYEIVVEFWILCTILW